MVITTRISGFLKKSLANDNGFLTVWTNIVSIYNDMNKFFLNSSGHITCSDKL